MAIRHTRWSPDTCGCVVDYAWDDAVDPALRTVSASAIVAQCPAHAGQAITQHFTTLQDENQRKNGTVGSILSALSTLVTDDLSCAFDANRVLNITCSKLTSLQKNTLQITANSKFGAGRVLFL